MANIYREGTHAHTHTHTHTHTDATLLYINHPKISIESLVRTVFMPKAHDSNYDRN
jgi:hypothetical protein